MNPVAAILVTAAGIALTAVVFVGAGFLLLNRSHTIQMAESNIDRVTDQEAAEAENAKVQLEIIRRKHSKLPLRYGRHPFEVCIIVSFLFSALSLAVFGPAATATYQGFTQPTVVLLGISIALGSVVTLVGVFMRDAILSAFFEAGGMLGVGGPVTVYLLSSVMTVATPSSALGVMSMLAIWTACIWRFMQLARWIKWIYRHPNPLGADEPEGGG